MDNVTHDLGDAVAGTVKVLPQIWSPERIRGRDESRILVRRP
jgi:hypothetical protein